jgi:phospholipase C
VDHTPIEQTSVLRFIENNWLTGRIGDASFDTRAGSLGGLFDWWHPQQRQVLLDPSTGAVSAVVPTKPHWPAPPRGGWAAQP